MATSEATGAEAERRRLNPIVVNMVSGVRLRDFILHSILPKGDYCLHRLERAESLSNARDFLP